MRCQDISLKEMHDLKGFKMYLVRRVMRLLGFDRGRKTGGGLCMYIKNSTQYDDCTLKDLNFSDENLEIQFVVIN